jgi:signal transduction histidine kinase
VYDINETVRRVIIGRMNELEQRGIDCTWNLKTTLPGARRSGPHRAGVYNLVDNALKFINDRGNLTIHTALVHDKVSVVVRNDGAPILPEDRPHIFDRLQGGQGAHVGKGSGTGLGLSICQRIIGAARADHPASAHGNRRGVRVYAGGGRQDDGPGRRRRPPEKDARERE